MNKNRWKVCKHRSEKFCRWEFHFRGYIFPQNSSISNGTRESKKVQKNSAPTGEPFESVEYVNKREIGKKHRVSKSISFSQDSISTAMAVAHKVLLATEFEIRLIRITCLIHQFEGRIILSWIDDYACNWFCLEVLDSDSHI